MAAAFRHTKIVCTLGPATDRPGILRQLVAGGLDVARINAAHGTPEEHARRIRAVRRLARALGRPVAVLLDLPGPKLRLGRIDGEVRELRRGSRVVLVGGASPDPDALPVRIPRFARQVRIGEPVFLSDGSVRVRIERIRGRRVHARVLVGGTIRSGSGLNLPESRLAIRLPTAEDARWIRFGRAHEVDWIGVSFVRSAADVAAVRRRLGAGPRPLLVAKIEKRQALEALDGIAAAADALMVARGDLGVETPLPEVPLVQKRIIAAANRHGKPVITATQMLESMVEDPTPTRAEVTDVANAVLDGTDAVMLSAETAIGLFPLAALETLREVILATERSYPFGAPLGRAGAAGTLEAELGAQAVRLAGGLGAEAIVLPASAVEDAAALSRLRPEAPILAFTASERLLRQLVLLWGVAPLRLDPGAPLKRRLAAARAWFRARDGARGDRLVLLSPSGIEGERLDTLRVVGARAPR